MISFEILEKFCEGKNGPDTGEDSFVLSDDFVSVIDGETKKDSSTVGLEPIDVVAKIVESILKLPRDVDANQAIRSISSAVDEMYISLPPTIRRPGASLVIVSAFREEIWRVGDVRYAIDGEAAPYQKKIDLIASEFRSAFLSSELLSGKSTDELLENDEGRKLVLPLLVAASRFRNLADLNSVFSFGSVDGTRIPDHFIEIHKIPTSCKEIIITSDGYPEIRTTLHESEQVLKKLITEDPLCIGPLLSTKGVAKGQKSFDDRTWIRLRIHRNAQFEH